MKPSRIPVLFSLLLTLLLGGCDGNRHEETETTPPAKKEYEGVIVALGDSLTAGLGLELELSYPSLLQQKLEEQGMVFRVVNAGVSGETSSGTLSRLDWILSQNPDIVILEIGANDGLRGIDTELVERNIDEILTRLHKKDVVVVLAGMKMVWNLGERYTGSFNAIYPKLAEKHGVVFMPFFLEDVAAVPRLNQADGIHPNEEGYRVITGNILPYVREAIERFRLQRE